MRLRAISEFFLLIKKERTRLIVFYFVFNFRLARKHAANLRCVIPEIGQVQWCLKFLFVPRRKSKRPCFVIFFLNILIKYCICLKGPIFKY